VAVILGRHPLKTRDSATETKYGSIVPHVGLKSNFIINF